MTYNFGNFLIDLDVPIGIYSFDLESSTGKTYLFKVLREYSQFSGDFTIFTITYYDVDTVKKFNLVLNSIRNNKFSLIILDRADLYITRDLCDILNNTGAIVLVDLKRASKAPNLKDDTCFIEFNQTGIRVYS